MRVLVRLALSAAAALGPALACAQASTAVLLEPIEAVVTVTKVDAKARTVTVRGPSGNLHTLAVPPEAQNLDKVKPGDRFRMAYAEAAVLSISKGGEPTVKVDKSVKVAPKGALPGGQMVRTVRLTATVDAIDYKSRRVALRGPKGNVVALAVSPEVKDLERVAAGDRVSIVYSEAIALEMVAQQKK
jgi:Cu/Ag efflux protein CusF